MELGLIRELREVGLEAPVLMIVVVFVVWVLRLVVRFMADQTRNTQRLTDSCHQSHREIAATLTEAMRETRDEHRVTMTGVSNALDGLREELSRSRFERERKRSQDRET